jgi:hypothetical protein
MTAQPNDARSANDARRANDGAALNLNLLNSFVFLGFSFVHLCVLDFLMLADSLLNLNLKLLLNLNLNLPHAEKPYTLHPAPRTAYPAPVLFFCWK